MQNSKQKKKKKSLKILHLPINWSGAPMDYSLALRKRGHRSRHLTLTTKPTVLNFNSDISLTYEKTVKNLLRLLFTTIWALFYFEIFHFYGRGFVTLRLKPSNSFIEQQFERLHLPFLKLLRKKIYFSFLGCDMRMPDINKSLCPQCPFSKYQWYKDMKWRALGIINRYADGVFLPPALELFKYVSRPYRLRIAIDTTQFEYVGISGNLDSPKIVHAPTHNIKKGTSHVLEAIRKLKDEKYQFQFGLYRNIPHEEFLRELKEADIILDQFIGGSFGKFALESMAIGKPVFCYMKEEYLPYFPDLPIVSTKKEEIFRRLRFFLDNPHELVEISKKSRKYVEEYHDSLKIAGELERVYFHIDLPLKVEK